MHCGLIIIRRNQRREIKGEKREKSSMHDVDSDVPACWLCSCICVCMKAIAQKEDRKRMKFKFKMVMCATDDMPICASLTPIQWLISVESFWSCHFDRSYMYRKIQIKRKFRRWIFGKKIRFNWNESDECHHWPSLVKIIFSWFLIKSKLDMTHGYFGYFACFHWLLNVT